MNIHTARYVNISDVFEGFPKLAKIFNEGDNYDFSWGDNNRSMIDARTLRDALDQSGLVGYEPEEGEVVEDDVVTQVEWDAFCKRLDSLPDDVHIDLEN